VGVVTDGDLRRGLREVREQLEKTGAGRDGERPERDRKGALAAVALRYMEEFSITSLFVFHARTGRTPIAYSTSTTSSKQDRIGRKSPANGMVGITIFGALFAL